ncbi:MAG: hypothetical protein KBH14_04880, partial [Vicinamibacteria bacterium]|nr:hypothetical protein [Vicinamibacteria bacterium]
MEERRLILAFALSFAVLLGFRMWTNSRYPQPTVEQTPAAGPAASGVATATSPAPTASPAATRPDPIVVAAPVIPAAPVVTGDERRVEIATREAEVAFSSRGARLLSWKLLEYKDPRGKAVEAHPGGNPIPGPLDLVTGRADLDARLRDAQFKATDLVEGSEKGARFEYSDGALVVSKTIRTI